MNRQYAAMADPDEKAAMGQVLSQLTTMADRLAVAATRRPLLSPTEAAPAAADAATTVDAVVPYLRPEQLYGAEKYRDPLLRVLDGVYQAVVVDSGLREFLVGIKQLGDNLVASMELVRRGRGGWDWGTGVERVQAALRMSVAGFTALPYCFAAARLQ